VTGAMSRRAFLATVGAAAGSAALSRALSAQGTGGPSGAANVPMDASAYRPVRLEAKGTPAVLSRTDIDALEHRLACACPCNLSVFTCRTTDFTCTISPAMHRDILALADGGYDAQEIIDAHVQVYGVQVLMAPPREGFNWAAYLTPFAALGGGAAVVFALLRKWRQDAPQTESPTAVHIDASAEELARLREAVRRDA
jgi:cytochrome c-type biogenesis protein CcmH